MKKRMSDKYWIPFWVDKWIFGSMRIEFEPDERALWIDLLALAAKDDGYVRANEETPYLIKQLAGLLVYDEDFFEKTIKKFEEKGKIKVDKNGIIFILKWDKYQFSDDYKRKIKQRLKEKVTENVTTVTKKDTNRIEYNKTKHNKIENNMSENIEKTFEKLWKEWPKDGRFLHKYCLMKFKALVKQGKLEKFQKITLGYGNYLKHKQEIDGFVQRVMHLKTWMNNWEGEEQYIGKKYKPKL